MELLDDGLGSTLLPLSGWTKDWVCPEFKEVKFVFCRLDYLSPSLFYFFSAFQALYFIFVFVTDARISNLNHPLASVMKTYFPH